MSRPANQPADLIGYRDGQAHVEGVALSRIADAAGTPTYVYSRAALIGAYRQFAGALDGMRSMICYAIKANGNLAVVRTFAELGAGADVVSLGEMKRALQAGIPASRIVFAGLGKTREEMAAAIEAGIHQFNVESEDELRTLSEVAQTRGARANVALRINPDIDAGTHEKITTGRKENKFGIDFDHAADVARLAAAMPGIAFHGIAVHIGSQLTSLAPFRQAFARIVELTQALRGQGIKVDRLDLGGGIGVAYGNEVAIALTDYARTVAETVGNLGCQLVFEPGRLLVANAGLLLSRVVRVKEGAARRFVVLDAAMNDLVRPAMYGSFHAMMPVREPAPGARASEVDVVGPICESSDQFAIQRPLSPLLADELLAILSAGAYGFAMASTYNMRPLAAEVMVDSDQFSVVRPRQDYDDLLGADTLPDRQETAPRTRGAA